MRRSIELHEMLAAERRELRDIIAEGLAAMAGVVTVLGASALLAIAAFGMFGPVVP